LNFFLKLFLQKFEINCISPKIEQIIDVFLRKIGIDCVESNANKGSKVSKTCSL